MVGLVGASAPLLLLLLLLLQPRALAAETVPVADVRFDALLEPDAALLRAALLRDGIFQVRGIPGFAALRRAALRDLGACAADMQRDSGSVFDLQDGTVRKTMAATTHLGKAHGLALEALFPGRALAEDCEVFERSSLRLRQLVTRVSGLVFSQLDALCGTGDVGSPHFARSADDAKSYPSAQAFLNAGEHLEHFHAYEAECDSVNSSLDALPMHTDDGLFIAIVPSLFLDAETLLPLQTAPAATGFLVEAADGRVAQPALEDDGDVLVFMLGQGIAGWVDKCPPLRPVPHALVMSAACALGAAGEQDAAPPVRAWYGRMFLPPRDAIDEQTNLTFAETRAHHVASVLSGAGSHSAGCTTAAGPIHHKRGMRAGGSARVVRDLAQGCPAGESRCWMQCMAWGPESGCSDALPDSSFRCETPEGQVWVEGDDHCPTCKPTCLEIPVPVVPGAICNGYGTAMYMLGFQSGLDPVENCVVLLFNGFLLDTPGKFAAGAIGSFLFGILVEGVILLRKRHLKAFNRGELPWGGVRVNKAAYMLLFVVQVTFGYLAMLIAMTYSSVLFICIVLGLATGHFFLNMNLRKAEGAADPCCQFAEDVSTDGDESSNGDSAKVRAAPKTVVKPNAGNATCCGGGGGTDMAEIL